MLLTSECTRLTDRLTEGRLLKSLWSPVHTVRQGTEDTATLVSSKRWLSTNVYITLELFDWLHEHNRLQYFSSVCKSPSRSWEYYEQRMKRWRFELALLLSPYSGEIGFYTCPRWFASNDCPNPSFVLQYISNFWWALLLKKSIFRCLWVNSAVNIHMDSCEANRKCFTIG